MPTQVLVSISDEVRYFLNAQPAPIRKVYRHRESIDLDDLCKMVDEHNKRVNNDKRSSFNLADVTKNCQVVARLNNDAEVLSKLTPLERMRAEAAERKYQRSIGAELKGAKRLNFVAAAHRKQGESSVAEEVKGVSENISTALHFIMAFVGSYAFGYYFIRVFREYWDPTYRYLFGGFCCVLTLFVEAILFIVRDEKADLIAKNARMRAREKARQEAVEMRQYREKLEEETRKAEEEPDELEDAHVVSSIEDKKPEEDEEETSTLRKRPAPVSTEPVQANDN